VNFLAITAGLAGAKVIFGVTTHLRRQPGNVISPARQDLPYDWINALLTHGGLRNQPNTLSPLQPNRLQCFGLGRQNHAIREQPASRCQRFLRLPPGYFRMIVLL
jgi:hypothetical protein